jgi:HEAT repeats
MRRILLVHFVMVVAAVPATAGWFDKKVKANPAERVGMLLVTLKTDADAGKRADAAGELRNFDGRMYPEIIPALLEVLKNDSAVGVRREAAQSLGRIKPASAEVDRALADAQENDSSTMVRLKARMARVGYRVPESDKDDAMKPPALAGDKPTVPVLPPASKLLTPVSRPLPKPEGDDKPMPLPMPRTKPAEPAKPAEQQEPILVEPRPLSPSFSSARPILPPTSEKPAERPVEHRPILAAPKK